MKAVTAEFTVRHHPYAMSLLSRDDLPDGLVLGLDQLFSGRCAAIEAREHVFQHRRAHQAANVVDTKLI